MRDPERIRRFCDELAAIWQNECPDWRFGQFIVNVFGNSDPFYLEEDMALKKIRAFFHIDDAK